MRDVAPMRSIIVTIPAIAVASCSKTSVSAPWSKRSVATPKTPASDRKSATRPAQTVRERYHDFICVHIFSCQLPTRQLSSNPTSDACRLAATTAPSSHMKGVSAFFTTDAACSVSKCPREARVSFQRFRAISSSSKTGAPSLLHWASSRPVLAPFNICALGRDCISSE